MKIRDVNDICWGIVIVIFSLCLFIYGLIWLNREYDVDDRFWNLKREISDTYVAKQDIMKSAFKGEKNVTTNKR